MRRIFHILLFVSAFLFFWNSGVVNHTEADDAFEYAYQVEMDGHDWLYHPHHLLYGAATKGIYNGLQAIGYSDRAYPLLVFFSSLSAAGAVFLFYRFCYRRYSMRPVSSLFAAGLMALSYGFWRYAVEAEVILPASFLVLLAVFLATAPKKSLNMVLLAAFISGVSALFHVMNGVPVFIIIPLFYLLNGKLRYAVWHEVVAGTVVLFAYAWIFYFESSQVFSLGLPPLSERLEWNLFPKGLIGLSQCLVSGNFLFSFPAVSDWLLQLFPSRMLMEEVYLGRSLSMVQRIVPLMTLVLLSGMSLYGVVRAGSAWRKAVRDERTNVLMMVGGWQTIFVIALWFILYAGALLLMEPGNPEVWVMGLIPFWLLVCGLIIAPLARANKLWIVMLILIFLGLHNYVGGIGLLKHPESDYNIQKSAWVLEHATEGDIILTAENPVFVRYLKYHSKAEVIDLNQSSSRDWQTRAISASKVYILNDVFEYPASMKVRFPSQAKRVETLSRQLRPHVGRLLDNEFGGIWLLEKQGSSKGMQ
ncbi:MAG: hypothetical protein K9M45_08125 [Kiritimatiellales bacterium]|nr:hypothetical protein [Kiritimatiellales bacterium]